MISPDGIRLWIKRKIIKNEFSLLDENFYLTLFLF